MHSAVKLLAKVLVLGCLLGCSADTEPAAPSPAPSRSTPEPGAAAAPEPPSAPAAASPGSEDPIERGRRVYAANCVVCHNPDPNLNGPIGPVIAGSPRELVEARVMRAGYPPGHTPKRDTKLMMPLPHLEAEIPAIAAFLAAAVSPQ